jgi:hypothetical protein
LDPNYRNSRTLLHLPDEIALVLRINVRMQAVRRAEKARALARSQPRSIGCDVVSLTPAWLGLATKRLRPSLAAGALSNVHLPGGHRGQ